MINVPDFSGKNILIAEDETLNFQLLEASLQNTRANVLWAKNGKEAVSMVEQHHIDLVLMDIRMPEMNGFDATIEIKRRFPFITVVVQTAYAMSYEREQIMQAGCDEYMTKPIRQEMLFNTLCKFL